MKIKISKKTLLIAVIGVAMIVAQTFAQEAHKHHDDDDKPTNLKVLPKDISEDQLDDVMKNFCKSLGVKCGHCHVSHQVPGREKPKFDFASDDKEEKELARDMMKMTASINEEYIAKMGDHKLEHITCVTCHNGNEKPNVKVESLPRKN